MLTNLGGTLFVFSFVTLVLRQGERLIGPRFIVHMASHPKIMKSVWDYMKRRKEHKTFSLNPQRNVAN